MLLPGLPPSITMSAVRGVGVSPIAFAFAGFANCVRCRKPKKPVPFPAFAAGASTTWCVVGSAVGLQPKGVPPMTRWPL